MISVRELSFHHILQNISLEIPDDGVTGLVGPNGSGKTTLLRCLFGANRPTAGSIHIDGEPLRKMPARVVATKLAVVSQEPGEPPEMTVAETVRLGQLPGGQTDDQAILEALRRVGMEELAKRPMTKLSGGERQRAMIARAFVQGAQHLLLDEPTNHLDVHHQLEIFSQLLSRRASTVVVLHDLNHALEYCDRVHLLDEGRLVASGSPDDVLTPELLEPIYRVRVIKTRNHLHFERNIQ